MSEIFQELAGVTQNKNFIKSIKERVKKVIDKEKKNNILIDIRYAENMII